jgi:hypothetical protein
MNLQLPFSILVCGKPKTGKSHIIKYLLYLFTHKNDIETMFSYGVVFCKTKFNHSYDFIPKQWLYDRYEPKALKALMNVQSTIRQNGYMPPHAFVIFDDCLGAKQFKSDLFKDLVQNYRHYNITPIISTQYVARIETVNRECVSNAIIFRQFSKPAIEACYKSFGQRFNGEAEFKKYMYDNTGDYRFIFVNNECIDSQESPYKIMKGPPNIPDPIIYYKKKYSLDNLKRL